PRYYRRYGGTCTAAQIPEKAITSFPGSTAYERGSVAGGGGAKPRHHTTTFVAPSRPQLPILEWHADNDSCPQIAALFLRSSSWPFPWHPWRSSFLWHTPPTAPT